MLKIEEGKGGFRAALFLFGREPDLPGSFRGLLHRGAPFIMIPELKTIGGGIRPLVILICRRGEVAYVFCKRERYSS